MGDSSKKDDNWDFKVDEADLKATQKPRKKVKASGGDDNISPEEINRKKKKRKLEVESVRKTKMTRAAIARRDAALEQYAELMPPGPISRILSTVIDYGLIALIFGVSYYFYEDIRYQYVQLLSEKGINQTLPPDQLKQLLIGVITFLGSFVLIFMPAVFSQKTPGKTLMNIRIGHATIGERPTKKAILLREMILKPLSVISVLGVLIGLKNDGSRCLHDMLTGTALYIDD
jgi:uncharacterized RDD family membrane protein YckC